MSLSQLLACPRCQAPLQQASGSDAIYCARDGLEFGRRQGIWDLIDPARRNALMPFISHYVAVRKMEGWGSPDPAYYRSLPLRDSTGCNSALWRIRARSFCCLRGIIQGLGQAVGPVRYALDLGAGNGWLAYRLTEMGFDACALDLSPDERNGLGAAVNYPAPFLCVLGEFERLPFPDAVFHLAVFSASLHYAQDDVRALASAARVLRPGGRIFILDSPIYRTRESGVQMVQEMKDRLTREFGLETWVQPGPGYLTFPGLRQWGEELGLRVSVHTPGYGLRWRARHLLARIRRNREPASFRIIELAKE